MYYAPKGSELARGDSTGGRGEGAGAGGAAIERAVTAGTPLDGKDARGGDQHYFDMKWAPDRGMVFAGGMSCAVDGFRV